MRRGIWISFVTLMLVACGWIQASVAQQMGDQKAATPEIAWDSKCMWVLDTMPITFGCDRNRLLGCYGSCSVGVLADDWASLCVPELNSACSGTRTKVTVLKYYEGRCQSDCSCADGEYLPYPVKVEINAYKCL